MYLIKDLYQEHINNSENRKKTNNPIRKINKKISLFTKEHIQMTNKHMKRCSTFLVTREMQIKTTVKYHYTPSRTAEIKTANNTKHW